MDSNDNININTIQNVNWNGMIPVQVTLAPTSVSSPTLPPPIHILISRNTYMHIALQDAIQRLHPFAPNYNTIRSFTGTLIQVNEPDPSDDESSNDDGEEENTGTNNKDKDDEKKNENENTERAIIRNDSNATNKNKEFIYPVCWFEDEETEMAIRWHIFTGVIYDLKNSNNNNMPWKIRVHFTNYPLIQILPIEKDGEIIHALQSTYRHSFKQALTILSNSSSKNAMNVTKESHGLLWESIITSNVKLYQRVITDTTSKIISDTTSSTLTAIPIRVFVGNDPPIQKRCVVRSSQKDDNYDNESTIIQSLGDLLCKWLPDHFILIPKQQSDCISSNNNDSNDDKSTDDSNNKKNDESTTTSNSNNNNDNNSITLIPSTKDTVQFWKVCGIQPSLTTNILDLWKCCSHPDRFLYIVVGLK